MVSFARYEQLRRDEQLRREGVLGPSTEDPVAENADEVIKRLQEERARLNKPATEWDTRHLAEFVQRYPITSPESGGFARVYPAAMPRKPVVGNQRPYRW
eukprot:1932007-Amphidinium_carterae.1